MIKEIKFKPIFNKFAGVYIIGIQAYKEFNSFGVSYIKFYELRKWNGFKSHFFIKSIQENSLNIDLELKKLKKDLIKSLKQDRDVRRNIKT